MLFIKPFKFAALAVLALSLSHPARTAAAEGEWIQLFNGQNLDGWTKRGGDATYKVVDGAIVGTNGPGHNTFLTTNRDFADFELEFETKLHSDLNSGVQIRSKSRRESIDGKEAQRVYGPQVEIERSPGEAGYIYGEQLGTGWLTPEDELKRHSLFKNDQWNRYRVVARGPKIQTWVNGTPVSTITREDIYENHASGFIGLQVHQIDAETGTRSVSWRNIRLRELD